MEEIVSFELAQELREKRFPQISLREHRDNLNYFQNLTYEDFLKEINQ